MTVEGFLVNPEVFQSLYGSTPIISEVRIRSVNLNWRGPTVTLRGDLLSFPESAPQDWIDAGVDTVQCQFQFLAVENVSLTEWVPPAVGTVTLEPWGEERRMRVAVTGAGIALRFDCNESVRVGHVSAFKIQHGDSDDGRHLFVSKIDARRHVSLPPTDERTFYER
ncbi:Imm50 family immunity protein [Streptomyces sp. NPDC059224]|uniref:Imm50 family immunity protein n=1 Tax=Streptomyces sp. NPDC059224 TaxID=3346775 RepID=UPI00368A58DB